MIDPDRPWLEDDEPEQTPDVKYVYRVRYITNQIEVLELIKRNRGGKVIVRDLDGGPDTTIANQGTFNDFPGAKAELVALNQAAVDQAQADLDRRVAKLRESQHMNLVME